MLDAYIINEIRRREIEQQRRDERSRPTLDIDIGPLRRGPRPEDAPPSRDEIPGPNDDEAEEDAIRISLV